MHFRTHENFGFLIPEVVRNDKGLIELIADGWELTALYALTSEPIFSPLSTLRIFPCRFRLKMMMGRLLSLQSEIAVESITFNPRFSTAM